MKVFVLHYSDPVNETDMVAGVYSTNERAIKAAITIELLNDNLTEDTRFIEEMEVDAE